MKTIFKTLAILFISILSISCNNDDDNSSSDSPQPTNDNFIRATVDGVFYEATGTAVTGDQNALAFNFRSDISGAGTGFDISINGQAAVGTYALNYSNAATAGRLNYKLNGDIYSSGICNTSSGTLTISAISGKTIVGTFAFTGKKALGCSSPAKVITNGAFKVTFP